MSDIFPWLDVEDAEVGLKDGGLLSRDRRSTNDTGSKSFFGKIEVSAWIAGDPLFGWLVGFLTSSSTTRLYRGGPQDRASTCCHT